MVKRNWDKYETALLVEIYINIENGADKKTLLKELSSDLRRLAILDGYEVDEKFRNFNGMQWQFGFLRFAFEGRSLESRRIPQIFLEIVDLYKNNREKYTRILNEAQDKIGRKVTEMSEKTKKQQFIDWIVKYEGKKCPTDFFIENFEKVSDYAVKRSISKNDCFVFDCQDVLV